MTEQQEHFDENWLLRWWTLEAQEYLETQLAEAKAFEEDVRVSVTPGRG